MCVWVGGQACVQTRAGLPTQPWGEAGQVVLASIDTSSRPSDGSPSCGGIAMGAGGGSGQGTHLVPVPANLAMYRQCPVLSESPFNAKRQETNPVGLSAFCPKQRPINPNAFIYILKEFNFVAEEGLLSPQGEGGRCLSGAPAPHSPCGVTSLVGHHCALSARLTLHALRHCLWVLPGCQSPLHLPHQAPPCGAPPAALFFFPGTTCRMRRCTPEAPPLQKAMRPGGAWGGLLIRSNEWGWREQRKRW